MVLHNLNFDPFHSRTVGFEKIFDRLSRIAESDIPSQSSYPPYNIHRQGDDKFDIEIAVAGFSEEDLDISIKITNLPLRVRKKKTNNHITSTKVSLTEASRKYGTLKTTQKSLTRNSNTDYSKFLWRKLYQKN